MRAVNDNNCAHLYLNGTVRVAGRERRAKEDVRIQFNTKLFGLSFPTILLPLSDSLSMSLFTLTVTLTLTLTQTMTLITRHFPSGLVLALGHDAGVDGSAQRSSAAELPLLASS